MKYLFVVLYLCMPLITVEIYTSIPIKCNKENDIYYQNQQINVSKNNFINIYYDSDFYSELNIGNVGLETKTYFNDKSMLSRIIYEKKDQKQRNKNLIKASTSFKNTSEIIKTQDDIIYIFSFNAEDYVFFRTKNTIEDTKYELKGAIFDFESYIKIVDDCLPPIENITLKNLNISLSFELGFKISQYSNITDKKKDFIDFLKYNGLIDSYDFTVDFYKTNVDNNIGQIIFGQFDELYDKNKYPATYLRTTKLEIINSNIGFQININQIKISTKKKSVPVSLNSKIIFKFNKSLFAGSKTYLNIIQKEFFEYNKDICKFTCNSVIRETANEKICFYVCKNNIIEKKESFPELRLYNEDLNFKFTFTYDDLFKTINTQTFFLVVFPESFKESEDWEVGQIFFKKYKVFFNSDKKIMRFYYKDTYVKPTKRKFPLIVIVIILLCILIIIGIFIAWKISRKRKLRANELEDNYEYIK